MIINKYLKTTIRILQILVINLINIFFTILAIVAIVIYFLLFLMPYHWSKDEIGEDIFYRV